MKLLKYAILAITGVAFNANAQESQPKQLDKTAKIDPQNVLVMTLKDGEVLIQLYPDKAPAHVNRIKELTKKGFYNGLTFHRVIDGFMVQTGDPRGDGTGKSDLPDLNIEYSDLKHERGTISMARGAQLNSANSQFFICLADAPHLDRQYTAFGKVIKGMEFVDKIKKGDPRNNGKVENPDKIIKLEIQADREKQSSPK